jgi:hypothetical protein
MAAPSGLYVDGNKVKDSNGNVRVFHGVNLSSFEDFARIGQFWSRAPDQAMMDRMRAKGVNLLRIPMNEAFWLGATSVPVATRGENYRAECDRVVALCQANDITPLLDLHWSKPDGGDPSAATGANGTSIDVMANMNYSVPFWQSVAARYRTNTGVMFDLYNEPTISHWTLGETAAWSLWKDGGTYTSNWGGTYQAAGMQDMLDAIRGVSGGCANICWLSGIDWGQRLMYGSTSGGWLAYKPTGANAYNMGASYHTYGYPHWNNYQNEERNTSTFRTTQQFPVGNSYPLAIWEIGQENEQSDYVVAVMQDCVARGFSWAGWDWRPVNRDHPSLISDWNGTPWPGYGVGYFNFMIANPAPVGGGETPTVPTGANPQIIPGLFRISLATLTGRSPASVVAGSGAQNVALTGTGFSAAAVARFNGAPRATTYTSATALTMALTATDVANPREATIDVLLEGGTTTTALAFTVTAVTALPSITAVAPAPITAGSGTLTLVVTGTGFRSGSLVQWQPSGGALSALPTSRISDTELRATVAAGLIAAAGTASVYVAAPEYHATNNPGAISAAFAVTIAAGSTGALPDAVFEWAVPAGTYDVTVQTRDQAGNLSAPSAPTRITIS